MFFPVVLCYSIFLGTERYVLVLGFSLKYLWYLVVIFNHIITFLFSFTRMHIFPNLWLFFHKRRLAEFWCCCFYIMNSYVDHMLSTSWKDHGRGLYNFISKPWWTDWSCWSRSFYHTMFCEEPLFHKSSFIVENDQMFFTLKWLF